MTRIQILDDASPEQLASFQDVCAICYMNILSNAKITPCGHFFHGACLKKWLFLQDNCPMCAASVIEQEEQSEQMTDEEEEIEDELLQED